MTMRAHTVITHAQVQAAPQGVSLRKITDTRPQVPMVLAMIQGDDSLSVARRNVSGLDCGWCPTGGVTAPVTFPGVGGWDDHMCMHHAYVYGMYVPVFGR